MNAPKCKLCGERHYGLCPGDYVIDRRNGAPEPMTETSIQGGKTVATTDTVRVTAKKLAKLRKRGLLNDTGVEGGDALAQHAPNNAKKPAVSTKPAAGAKPKYDRNAAHRAYMKEWMRKKRAAERHERLDEAAKRLDEMIAAKPANVSNEPLPYWKNKKRAKDKE